MPPKLSKDFAKSGSWEWVSFQSLCIFHVLRHPNRNRNSKSDGIIESVDSLIDLAASPAAGDT